MSDFYIRQGDTASDVADVLRDENGEAVNIEGADIAFVAAPLRGGDPIIDFAAAENDQNGDGTDGSKGKVRYVWQAGETNVHGDYLASWRATFSGGKVQTYPNGGYLLLTITPKAGEALTYVAVEELKKTLKLAGLTFADGDVLVALIAAAKGLDAEYGGPWSQGAPGEARYYSPMHEVTKVRLGEVDDVTEVALDQAGNGAYDRELVDGVDYRLEPVGAGPYTHLRWLRSGFLWDYCYRPSHLSPYPFGLDALRVTGTFGAAETPAGVKAATTIIATRVLRRMREAPFGGAIGLGLEGSIVRALHLARDPEVAFVMKGPRAPRRLVV